jgi:hypothetical protein
LVALLPGEFVSLRFDGLPFLLKLFIFEAVNHWFIVHKFRVGQCLGIVRPLWFNLIVGDERKDGPCVLFLD